MGANVLLVPNGVRADSYTDLDTVPPAPDVNLPRPVAGVVGQLSARIDITLLEAVVSAGCSLLMVGPVDPAWEPARLEALCARPNVRLVGFQPYDRLGGYLRHIDVGLTPYVPSEFNRASFPLKTLEYLAAGKPTVSTDLPATRWLDTDLVHIADGADDFAKAAISLAETDTPQLAKARRDFAEQHSWRARAALVADALSLPPINASER
jgi:teichuronic acid biosynthesis glycosyltransferase TuaH